MMSLCGREFQRGKHELARHNPEAALKAFESALNACPVDDPKELSAIFYFLGVTFLRLGKRAGALRSFRAATRLRKGSCFCGKMLHRFSNDYGMPRQHSADLDDWQAFYSIHLQRYLRSKRTQQILTEAEGDMIRDLIYDYWKRFKTLDLLGERNAEERLALFRSVEIVFPFYLAASGRDSNVIAVDFVTKTRLAGEDRCRCGSGLPFMSCCGRTRGVEELIPGTF